MATVEFTPENQKHFDFWMHGDGTLIATPKTPVVDCDACDVSVSLDDVDVCDDGDALCYDCHVGCYCLADWGD